MSENIQQKQKFSGARMTIGGGLMFAFVGSEAATVASLAVAYMALDPAVTMNRTFLGLGFTIFIIIQGVSAPLIGWIIHKKGPRFSYIIGSTIVMITGGVMAIFLGSSDFFYLITLGVVVSYGCMSAGQIPTMTLLNTWYHRNRGRAISISLTLGAVIALAYPIITNAAILWASWRAAFWLISLFAFLGLCIAILVIRNKPADLGQEVDGGVKVIDKEAEEKMPDSGVSKVYKTDTSIPTKKALKTANFWLIALISFACYSGLNMTMAQAGLYFENEGGIPLSTVSIALSAQAGGGIVVLLLLSGVLDKIEPIRLHGFAALLMGIGALAAILGGTSVPIMFFYYICVGVGYSAHTACMPAELANFFGSKYYSEIHGWLLPLVAILASFVPTLAGACYDSLGTYLPFFWVLVAVGVIGCIASFLVRIPKVGAPRMETASEEAIINEDANEVA